MTTTKGNPAAGASRRGAEEDYDGFSTINLRTTSMPQTANKPQGALEPEQNLDIPPFLDRGEGAAEQDEPISIAKPTSGFDLNRFKAKRDPSLAGVATLLTSLPVHKLADARDFIRLHPDEENYWSVELCVVAVPVKGQRRDTLHLIEEELALQYLQPASIRRYKLALGANPDGGFFLCTVPTQNLDNVWNADNLKGCEEAKSRWTRLSSRRDEGVDGYKVDFTLDADAFPEPAWPKQSLSELIEVTFAGRMITNVDHPGMRRLLGVKQSLK